MNKNTNNRNKDKKKTIEGNDYNAEMNATNNEDLV